MNRRALMASRYMISVAVVGAWLASVMTLGLFELFIDERLDLPAWLVLRDLDDLKNKLLKVIVVVLGVSFVSQALNWTGRADLL